MKHLSSPNSLCTGMRVRMFVAIFFLGVIFNACTPKEKSYKTDNQIDANGYAFSQVTNDPLKTRVYTLKNGLKVYLTQNVDEPRVSCLVGVRAGSTSDPDSTTGLAHYFEHMMFKGTSKLGTVNWSEESKQISRLEQLFEQYRSATDQSQKMKIYKEIDEVSQQAATYVATNEYDKLMSAIGAKSTNAGTSYESTVYMNDVPVNELERWAILESERFHDIVLRLFHTELETVYEEFNMYQDMDSERAFDALMSELFVGHPYGRSVIGLPDHIKNPSMVNIKKFFETYYVPNNIAIAMSGDIDFEKTIQLVDRYFGDLKYRELPQPKKYDLQALHGTVVKEVVGPEAENVMLAFRTGGVGTDDQMYCTLIDLLLSNSQAGLIDLDLVQQQKVLSASTYFYAFKEHGIHVFQGEPLKGQSLEDVKNLFLAELEKIKKGEFDDWLVQAVINDTKLSRIKNQEGNMNRAFELMNEFIDGLSREQALNYYVKLEKLTKEDIVRFANEKYSNNYVVVNKRQGQNSQLVKVDKPEITPVPINRQLQSEFSRDFLARQTADVEPVFLDFDSKIHQREIQPGCKFFYLKNETNELFTLRYIIDQGKWNDLTFDLAMGYLKFIGTTRFSPSDFQKELYKYGLELSVTVQDERSFVTLRGLNSSFEKGIELLEHLLADAKADSKAYSDYVGRILKERLDEKSDQEVILWEAMNSYGVYGSKNPTKHIIGEEQLKSIDPEKLVESVKKISGLKHKVFYYGPSDEKTVEALIEKHHALKDNLADVPAAEEFKQEMPSKSMVYFVDFDINQANILLLANNEMFANELIAPARIYNEYYGSGLSSVVFQDIRESKALAYSAFSSYDCADKPGRRNILMGYLGTQTDKLPIATQTLVQLMNNMPMAKDQYDLSRKSIIRKINSERITKEMIFWTWLSNNDRGIAYDIRKDEYEAAKNMSIEEFSAFFNQHIKGSKFTYLILGKKDNFDRKALQSLGEVRELSLEELFGY